MVRFFFSPRPRPLFAPQSGSLNFFFEEKKGCKKKAKRKSGVVRHKGKNASASYALLRIYARLRAFFPKGKNAHPKKKK